MLKYKQVNVVHPEDVGVPRKLMSDPPQDNNPSPAFRGSIWPIAVILLIISILAVCFLPWPERVELCMDGAKVDKQGNVITEGKIVVEGWQYHYLFQSEKFSPTKIELPGVEIGWFKEVQGDSGFTYWPVDLMRAIAAISIEGTEPGIIQIFTTENYNFLTIYPQSGNYSFVGTAEGIPDYVEILERCHLLKD